MARRLRGWWRSLDFTLARRFGLATREDRIFFVLIPLIGLGAGGLGLLVTSLIHGLQKLLWGRSEDLLAAALGAPAWVRLGAPAVGGALVGLLILASRTRVGGHGTSRLIEAVALTGGQVPARPVLLSSVAGIATVGSGGSLGREGPMIHLSAALASWSAVRLGMPSHRVKILLGCGVASGMAAIYNIPVGGALFAMEVLLGNFALEVFGPLVVSSVISTLVVRAVRGGMPIYPVPGYQLVSGWELLAYVGLGILGAVVSVVFVRAMRLGQQAFDGLRVLPVWLRPVVGMSVVGALGLAMPYVYGNGFETITLAVHGQLPLSLLVGLPLVKVAATAITAGSGCSGGRFTPSLFAGALVGGAYGSLLHGLWPHATAPYGAYAAVGMAAVAAGTSHAPISAILILFEFTGNYDLILPLMLASIIASVVARRLYRYSIYTESLERRGIDLAWRMGEAALAGLKVEDLMRADVDVLPPALPYPEVVERFLATRRQRLYVVGEDGRLLGAASLHDIKHALEHPEMLTAVVAMDLVAPVPRILRPDERLHRAAETFSLSDFERLPVVDEEGRYQGVLAKRDLLAVYAQEVLGRPALLATFVSSEGPEAARDYVELPPDFALRLVPVPPTLVGHTLAEARLPQVAGVRVIEIKRTGPRGEEQRVIPDRDTAFEEGDEMIVLGPVDQVGELELGRLRGGEGEAEAIREID